ncbi:hypothetical protein PI124_g19484 [Phytophthora idaei]|nr:hypothetical protein PI125_g20529 [Phytophthora idaei]KAG3159167.1 hypothetical protein PI126_g7522 [Phytophthora idaei]KAG3235481.1 hypothetical protein PI124_g19484 [Phytophthora idaei]
MPSDIADVEALVGSILDANISRYGEFLFKEHCRNDANHWKLIKSRDNTKVYSEHNYGSSRVGSTDLPSLLCFGTAVGTAVGDLEDMMFDVVTGHSKPCVSRLPTSTISSAQPCCLPLRSPRLKNRSSL